MGRTSWAEGEVLLASSTERIRDRLVARGEQPKFFDPISQEVEAELLARRERLLDLTLAEFCLHPETAQTLFFREPADETLRLLVLSNAAMANAGFFRGFPHCLFGSEEATLAFLSNVSGSERAALFSNPSLDDSFLDSFLSLGPPWEAMDTDQRLWALDNLAENEKLRRRRDETEFFDGWAWFMAGKPFAAAWGLIYRLEPSPEAAPRLSSLLRNLPADCSEKTEVSAALGKWQTPESEASKEADENDKGRLSAYQMVRQAGARLLASDYKAQIQDQLASDDVAIRCGAYEGARKLGEEALEAAVDRDGDLARVYLIRNEHLWRKQPLRDLLVDVLGGAKTEEPRWEFERWERHYRKQSPGWFADEDYCEPEDRPISESSMAELIAGVSNAHAIRDLQTRLSGMEKTQQYTFWIAGLALVILLSRAWS